MSADKQAVKINSSTVEHVRFLCIVTRSTINDRHIAKYEVGINSRIRKQWKRRIQPGNGNEILFTAKMKAIMSMMNVWMTPGVRFWRERIQINEEVLASVDKRL